MRSYDTLIHYPTNFDASLWLTRLLSYVYRARLMRDRRKLLLICSLASSYSFSDRTMLPFRICPLNARSTMTDLPFPILARRNYVAIPSLRRPLPPLES